MTCRRQHAVNLTLAALAAVLLAASAAGQIKMRTDRIAVPAAAPGAGAATQPGDDSVVLGSNVESNPEIKSAIEHAREYLRNQKYREATQLLQAVIERNGDELIQDATQSSVFRPVRDEAEAILLGLPEEGLSVYRLAYDGQAKGLLDAAADANLEAALGTAVRQYFATSHGGQAAYRLGGLMMDRYNFTAARRLFAKALTHPDPRLDRVGARFRLAVACARLGDVPGAQAALEELQKPGVPVSAALVALLEREVHAAEALATRIAPDVAGWPMALGTPRRDGHMLPLPAGAARDGGLCKLWEADYPLTAPPNRRAALNPYTGGAEQTANRADLVTRWRTGQWYPTGAVLLQAGKAYFRTHNSLRCVNAELGPPAPDRPYAWDCPDTDALSPVRTGVAMRGMWGGPPANAMPAPTTAEEVLLFADRLAKGMTLWEGRIYYLEGQAFGSSASANANMMMMMGRPGSQAGPGNTLVARNLAAEGKLLWKLAPYVEGEPRAGEPRFVAAPAPCGNLLLAPVEDQKGLALWAVDPVTGKVAWKTPLPVGAPAGGVAPWTTVGLAVDGTEVYLATGRGAVFALDGADGSLRWAATYERAKADPGNANMMAPWGVMMRGANTTGWDEDVVIPAGNKLLVLPSDAQYIFTLNRRTGGSDDQDPTNLWNTKDDTRKPAQDQARYCLGLLGNGLFVAGPRVARRYDLVSGKLVWEARSDIFPFASLGRGCLTADAVYLPVKNTIVRLDPATGHPLGPPIVVETPKDDPVGNLFSDGEHLFVAGMERVYALMDRQVRMTELDKRVEAGEWPARLARAKLRQQVRQFGPAVEDLRAAVAMLKDHPAAEQARRDLVEGLLALAQAPGQDVAALLAEAQDQARQPAQKYRVRLARGALDAEQGHLAAALDQYLAVTREGGATMVTWKEAPADPYEVESQVALLAAAALRQLVAKQGAPALAALEERAQAALGPALAAAPAMPAAKPVTGTAAAKAADEIDPQASAAVAGLLTLARAYPGTRAAATAVIAAAEVERHRWTHGAPEQAELYLRELTRAPDAATVAAGWAALARFHQALGWEREAARDWQRLARDYAEVEVPASASPAAARAKAGELAQNELAALAGPTPGSPAPAGLPEPPWGLIWEVRDNNLGVVELDEDEPCQWLEDHALILNRVSNKLRCQHLHNGRLTWELALPAGLVDPQQMMFMRGGIVNGMTPAPVLPVQRAGLIAVAWSSNQTKITGQGLVTGKDLWAEAAEGKLDAGNPNAQPWMNPYQGNFALQGVRQISVGAGVVAFRIQDSKLTDKVRVLDAVTGQPLWARAFDRQSVDGVWVSGGYVNLILGTASEIWVCDRLTGRRVGRFTLEDRQPTMLLCWTPRGLLYQTTRGVELRALPDGKKLWAYEDRRLQVGRAGMLGDRVCYLIGAPDQQTLALLDAQTGKPIVKFDRGDGQTFQDLALAPDGQTLYVVGANNGGQYQLTILDAGTGKLANRPGKVILLGQANAPPKARTLAAAGEYLPCLRAIAPAAGPGVAVRGEYLNQFELVLTRKSDGQPAPQPKIAGPGGAGRFEGFVGTPVVQQDVLLMTSQHGVTAYGKGEKK